MSSSLSHLPPFLSLLLTLWPPNTSSATSNAACHDNFSVSLAPPHPSHVSFCVALFGAIASSIARRFTAAVAPSTSTVRQPPRKTGTTTAIAAAMPRTLPLARIKEVDSTLTPKQVIAW
uniref:Secreted protein n=1 Tax=Oryza sativa subsp. japonica TaxID=39947 RepID=Q6EQ73_ORYSJ|nr:hypothetical protein [Oryza sativa Japonica Group]BAD29197.1 hypothetical protein [Oryza sativa Japonica Group]